MALLKQNNIQATAGGDTMLSKLAGKLDFSGMADRVVEFKKPPVLTRPHRQPLDPTMDGPCCVGGPPSHSNQYLLLSLKPAGD